MLFVVLVQFSVYGSGIGFLRFEVFMAVTMKNAAFWDVTPCDSCNNRRFGGRKGAV
jgi:hypothetical protein